MPTLISLFDGSGGFPLAGAMNGITPIAASEVEPYPIAVTKHRFPHMLHLGDISKINGANLPGADVITFGSPCQDVSQAGKRKGMKHQAKGDEETTRSGLFLEAIRIMKEMRQATNGRYPAFVIWENVPGAFSSAEGEDFCTVLEELCSTGGSVHIPRPEKWPHAGEILGDGYSLAWRQFDAQYWGVPQRRKRIHIVLDLGGHSASEILFDPESLQWNPEKSGTPWEGTAGYPAGSAGIPDRILCGDCGKDADSIWPEAARSLTARADGSPCVDRGPNIVCAGFIGEAGAKSGGIGYTPEGSPTLKAEQATNVVMGFQSFGKYKETDTGKSILSSDDITTGDLVVSGIDCRNASESELCGTLQAGTHGTSINSIYPVRIGCIVRRLTPLECCRLQGFPDGWGELPDCMPEEDMEFWERVRRTKAEIDGKKYRPFKRRRSAERWYNKLHTDSAEYKMWGNGIALPVAVYILRGVARTLAERKGTNHETNI